MEYVFGYGSLAWDGRCPVHQAELRGTRRVWGVAMDNTEDVPGYKHYRCRRDGSRPEVCVAFLDLEPAAGGVRQRDLPGGDAGAPRCVGSARAQLRPRGRHRSVVAAAAGATWAYVGRPESRLRLRRARARSRAVVSREYREHVLRGFAALGRDALAAFRRSTELEGLPVRRLGPRGPWAPAAGSGLELRLGRAGWSRASAARIVLLSCSRGLYATPQAGRWSDSSLSDPSLDARRSPHCDDACGRCHARPWPASRSATRWTPRSSRSPRSAATRLGSTPSSSSRPPRAPAAPR